MKLIGLTGGIASGKSLIESMFRNAGIAVIDADAISREVTQPQTPGLAQVIAHFGADYLLPDGSLNRPKLGSLVFSDAAARAQLERITHPLIREAMQQRLKQFEDQGHAYCVYSAALIFEKNLEPIFDGIILVFCDEATQLTRLMKRDGISQAEAKLRLSTQMPLANKLKRTPYQVDNSQDTLHTAADLSKVWQALTGQTVSFAE